MWIWGNQAKRGHRIESGRLRKFETMSNLKEVLDLHKKWLSGDSEGVRAILSGATLSGATLRGATLSGADLHLADLREADLREANLIESNLSGATLSGADLYLADLSEADLRETKGLFQFGPMPTSGRICTAVWHSDIWMVKAGCFWGPLDALEAAVNEKHKCPVYLAMIAILRAWKYE